MFRKANPNASEWAYVPPSGGIVNTTTAVTVRAAQPGRRNYITDFSISHATLGGATELAIRDGAGGTVLWRITLGTGANDLAGRSLETPIVGSVNTLLEIVTLSAVTGGVYVNMQGFSQ